MNVACDRWTIFHVDDDPAILDITDLSLSRSGAFHVWSFGSAPAALDHLPLLQPHLVLLDLIMPRVDGFMFLKDLQNATSVRRIPVILMTARPGKAQLACLTGMGVIGLIAKPFDPLRLPRDICKLWGATERNESG